MKTKLLLIAFALCANHLFAQSSSPYRIVPVEGRIRGLTLDITGQHYFDMGGWEHVIFIVKNLTDDEVNVEIDAVIYYTCGRQLEGKINVLGGGPYLNLKPHESIESQTWVKETNDSSCIRKIAGPGIELSTITRIVYDAVLISNVTLKENEEKAAEQKKEAERQQALANEKQETERQQALVQGKIDAGNKQQTSLTQNQSSSSDSNNNFWNDAPSKNTAAKSTGNQGSAGTANNNSSSINNTSRSNLPDLAITNDGKYYRKDANNNYHEISQQEYNQAKQQQQQAYKQQNLNTYNQAQQNSNNNINNQQKSNLEIEKNNALMAQSYYTVQNAKNNLNEDSKLSGNYTSIEQLEAEFNSKYYSINQDVNEKIEAQNQQWQNSTLNLSGNAQAAGEAVASVGILINSLKADKEKKKLQEQLKAQHDEELAKLQAMKKAMILQMRNQLLANFPDGGVPLSSQNVPVDELYYFAYVFDKGTIGSSSPQVYVSNVFPVARYSDSTWPFKTSITNEIAKTGGIGTTTLMGFYSTQALADDTRASFLRLAAQTGFTVKDISYKGKKSPGTKTDGGNDFWETGNKKTDANKQDSKKTDDFWNN